jgi:hypothetical protein
LNILHLEGVNRHIPEQRRKATVETVVESLHRITC